MSYLYNEEEQLGKAFTDYEMFLTIPANIMQQWIYCLHCIIC